MLVRDYLLRCQAGAKKLKNPQKKLGKDNFENKTVLGEIILESISQNKTNAATCQYLKTIAYALPALLQWITSSIWLLSPMPVYTFNYQYVHRCRQKADLTSVFAMVSNESLNKILYVQFFARAEIFHC